MKRIVIDIRPDGSATVDAQGFRGMECKDATRAIERALGAVSQDQTKPELHSASGQPQRKDQRQ